MKRILLIAMGIIYSNLIWGQCIDSANIYSFMYDNKTYEIIRENKTWTQAAACALERGGMLLEINDANEQNAIFNELTTNAGINLDNTIAPDGGGSSYVWMAGNDISTEGVWIWDGDNDQNGIQFWQDAPGTGNPVGGAYSNWGPAEPDDFGFPGQDGLGIALNDWPLGAASEWNDIADDNLLYFIIEYPSTLSIGDVILKKNTKLFPNPVIDQLIVQNTLGNIKKITIYSIQGKQVKSMVFETLLSSILIDFSDLSKGAYFVNITSQKGDSIIKKIVKQ